MKHNIDGFIIANRGIRNAVMALFNGIDNSHLWDVEYSLGEIDGDDVIFDKNKTAIVFHICFNAENDRDNVLASFHGLDGMLNNCETGSYYRKVLSDHDIDQRTGSVILEEWFK